VIGILLLLVGNAVNPGIIFVHKKLRIDAATKPRREMCACERVPAMNKNWGPTKYVLV